MSALWKKGRKAASIGQVWRDPFSALRCGSLQPVWPPDILPFAAEKEAGFDTTSTLFTVTERVKEEKNQQTFQPCFSVPDSPGSVVLVLETFMREDLKFPLRTAEFLRVGWMVFASLFRKEKLDLYLSADSATFGCKAVGHGDQKGFLFNLPAKTKHMKRSLEKHS